MGEQKASGYKAAASGLMQFPIREVTTNTPGRQESTTATKGIFCLPDEDICSSSGPREEFAASAGMWSNFDGCAQQQASIEEFNDFLFDNSWNTNQEEG